MIPRPLATFVVVCCVLLAGTLAPAVAGAQEGFPEPVVAAVLPPADTPAPLAVTGLSVDPAEAALEVRFREGFDLPDVFRYRIALLLGRPGGDVTRVSLLAEGGAEVGVVETGVDDDFTAQGAVEVALAGGVATIGLPEGLAVGADDLAWVDVALVEEEGGSSDRFTTPLFPARDLLEPAGPGLRAAAEAWGSTTEQPPAEAVETGPPPSVRLAGDELVVTFEGSPPTQIGGTGVASVVDVVRIASGFTSGAVAPYLVAIDHGAGAITLLDGTQPLPVEVPTDGSWIIDDLPPSGVTASTEVRVSLAGVLDAFGLPDDPDITALGAARSITLADNQVVRADGALGTVAWFEEAASAPPPAEGSATTIPAFPDAPAEDAAGATGGDDEGRDLLPVVAVVCVVILLGALAWLGLRWREHRRHLVVTGASSAPAPSAASRAPSAEERARLEAFTTELFGGSSTAGAGGSGADHREPVGPAGPVADSGPVADPAPGAGPGPDDLEAASPVAEAGPAPRVASDDELVPDEVTEVDPTARPEGLPTRGGQ